MILEVKNLFKTFKGHPPLEVLRGLSLEVDRGESVAIMGQSGEGKSTLLHILGTLDTPTKGDISICGQKITGSQLGELRNMQIGFIFQAYHLLEDFTVLDNILMPLKIRRALTQKSKESTLKVIQEVGLSGKEKVLAKFLSGGEKQRVAIARALNSDPSIILADEPTGNLDEKHSKDIQELLLSKAKESSKALIIATHDPEFAARCDRLLFLKGGQLYNAAT